MALCRALRLIRLFAKEGKRAWLVGGAVRDLLMGRTSFSDMDVAVEGEEGEIQNIFPHAIFVGKKGKRTGIIFFEGEHVDIFPLGSYPLEEDLGRRDFTVNAIAIDGEGDVYDPFGGLIDLERGLLRFNGDPMERLKDDPIRTLRLCRFSASLSLKIDEDSSNAVKAFAPLIPPIPGERIGHEVLKALDGDALLFFRLVSSHQLMPVFFPFLEVLKDQRLVFGDHYEGGRLLHSLLSLQSAQNFHAESAVQMAALLHHVGYPSVEKYLIDWAWPAALRNEIEMLVKYHSLLLAPLSLETAVSINGELGAHIVEKLFLLARAILAASGKSDELCRKNRILYSATAARLFCADFLPDGDELMSMLNVEEGPLIGILKVGLRQAVAKKEIRSREDVVKWLEKNTPDGGVPTSK